MMASMSQAQKDNKGDVVVGEKYAAWVARMSDEMVVDALSACCCHPPAGPLVDANRDSYRRLLENTLKSDERRAVGKIEDYLAQQQPEEVKERWLASGLLVDLHSIISTGTGASSSATSDGTPPRPSDGNNAENDASSNYLDSDVTASSSGSGARDGLNTKEAAAAPAPREEPPPVVATSTPRSSLSSDSSEMRSLHQSDNTTVTTTSPPPPGLPQPECQINKKPNEKNISEVARGSGAATNSRIIYYIACPEAGYNPTPSEPGARVLTVTKEDDVDMYNEFFTKPAHLQDPPPVQMNNPRKNVCQRLFVALLLVVVVILGYMFYANQNPGGSVGELVEFILGAIMEENGQEDHEAAAAEEL